MFRNNPWEAALQEIVANGEADNLTTTSIDVFNRLSDMAHPMTGICVVDIAKLSIEVNREGPLLNSDLVELINNRLIKKNICLDMAVITLHDRFKEKAAWAR